MKSSGNKSWAGVLKKTRPTRSHRNQMFPALRQTLGHPAGNRIYSEQQRRRILWQCRASRLKFAWKNQRPPAVEICREFTGKLIGLQQAELKFRASGLPDLILHNRRQLRLPLNQDAPAVLAKCIFKKSPQLAFWHFALTREANNPLQQSRHGIVVQRKFRLRCDGAASHENADPFACSNQAFLLQLNVGGADGVGMDAETPCKLSRRR